MPSPEQDIIWLFEENGINLALKIFARWDVFSFLTIFPFHGLLKHEYLVITTKD